MDFYSHITEEGKFEPVAEHLKNTAVLASKFSESFDTEKQAHLIGWG